MRVIDIYYTDDDEDDLLFFSDAIEKIALKSDIEINLHLYNNGDEFFENIIKVNHANSIVFLDINMPCKSGYEVLQDIRNEPTTKKIPTIMFSTSSDGGSITKCQWLGATHYAIKPSDFNTLINILSRLIAIDWDNYNPDNEMFLIR